MDPLAHTLVAAVFGEAGLAKKSRHGMATLIIAANLPDIDGLTYLWGENLTWRRGLTHGPIAMLVLSPLLAGAMMLFGRWLERRGKPGERPQLNAGWLVALAFIGLLSHPLLDWLNIYGIRPFVPFSDQWFHGNILFVVDVWLWTALAVGLWLSRRRRIEQRARPGLPALAGLALSIAYIAAMGASNAAAERLTVCEARSRGLPVRTVFASPVPFNPLRREVLVATDQAYRSGQLHWLGSPTIQLDLPLLPKNMDDSAVAQARKAKAVAEFLAWSRFPFVTIKRSAEGTSVTFADARYGNAAKPGRFAHTIHLPAKGRTRADTRSVAGEAPRF